MTDALKTMLPMLAFMLIPIWIPMIAVAASRIAEAVNNLRGVTTVSVSADTIRARATQTQPA